MIGFIAAKLLHLSKKTHRKYVFIRSNVSDKTFPHINFHYFSINIIIGNLFTLDYFRARRKQTSQTGSPQFPQSVI